VTYMYEKLVSENKAFFIVHCLSQNIFAYMAYYVLFKNFIILSTEKNVLKLYSGRNKIEK
jgi:hypothetical protein